MTNNAYVYAIVVDGVIRYIGKGSGGRARAHLRIVRSIARRRAAGEVIRTSHFYNRLTKAWLGGAEIEERILIDGLTHSAALEAEIATIAHYPTPQLWNLWPGGEGPPHARGRPKSVEHRRKIAESNKQTWSDSQLLAEHGARCKVVALRSDVNEKLRRPKSEEHRQGISERAKIRWADPAFCAKMQAIYSSPEFHERRSQAIKRGWATRRANVKT